jgi:hypothetical protein
MLEVARILYPSELTFSNESFDSAPLEHNLIFDAVGAALREDVSTSNDVFSNISFGFFLLSESLLFTADCKAASMELVAKDATSTAGSDKFLEPFDKECKKDFVTIMINIS